MPTTVGPNTYGEENLVFGYDLGDVSNSYKGEPTTNFAYLHNGRKDSSYESYLPESATGQMAALHPGAIRVYNQNGSDISYYLNTGINTSNSGVEWYNTNHAYWVYDEILKKPVVQMIDRNAVWQAKYMGLGVSWTDLGLTNGDQYTMSWLQWSSDGVKRAHAGVYWYDTTAGYSNFWDGLSDTGNSTPGKWTRVSQTFTLSAGKSLDQGLTWYMYGMYYSRAILRIADVQLEKKSHATPFTFSNTRSNTQGLIDLTGNSSISLSNVSFDSNAQMTFDGTNDTASTTTNITLGSNFSMEAVVYRDTSATGDIISSWNNPYRFLWRVTSGNVQEFAWNGGGASNTATGTGTVATGVYRHVTVTYDGVSVKFYTNGTLTDTSAKSFSLSNITAMQVGSNTYDSVYFDGKIPFSKIYNRALSASEVKANFNAIKGRFNI